MPRSAARCAIAPVRGEIDRAAGLRRVVDHADGEQAAQDAAHHVVDPGLRHPPGGDGGAQRAVEERLAVQVGRGLRVEPGQRRRLA